MSILTIADLERRSKRSPGDLCWHWQGAKAPDGTPRIWTFCHDALDKKVLSGPKAVWNIAHGESPRGRLVFRSCVCTDCVNPAHMKLANSKAEIGAHIRLNGARKGSTPERLQNIQAAWAAAGVIVTPPDVVRAIRADSGTLKAIGARHGVNYRVVGRIRRGESHRNVA